MSAYVDFSSSDDSEQKVAVPKRRRNDDSESGSDVSILRPETMRTIWLICRFAYSTILLPIPTLMVVVVVVLVQQVAKSQAAVVAVVLRAKVAEETLIPRKKRNRKFPMPIVMYVL